MFPKIKNIAYITRDQMIEVDNLMINEYGINLYQMMENSGRNLAYLTKALFLSNDPVGKSVIAVVGTGGNGGGVLAAARRLHNWGAFVQVLITKESQLFKEVPRHQLKILERLNIPIDIKITQDIRSLKVDVILDGVIGYNIKGHPKGSVKRLINFINKSKAKIISLDIPSGMDPDKGTIYIPYIKADATLTLALPKKAFEREEVRLSTGDLYLADISVPDELYNRILKKKSDKKIFSKSEILHII